jgi:hypothetical protein
LRGTACLWLDGAYYPPNAVFWGEHPFGRYRRRLGDELRNYAALLNFLHVREAPTWADALDVLHDISAEFAPLNKPLDDEAFAVLMSCWRVIAQAIEQGAAAPERVLGLRSTKCVPDGRRVLNPPDWMFFENRAGLAAKFGPYLMNNVIPRPIGAGKALDAAGVRSLGTAVKIELLECVDPVDDPELGERVRTRRNEIGRVLEAHGTHNTAESIQRIDDIRFQSATSIEIRCALAAFNRELKSAPEYVPALYLPEQQTMVFSYRNESIPWPAISRELVIGLFPEEDPGRFAAGFKEVLAADTAAPRRQPRWTSSGLRNWTPPSCNRFRRKKRLEPWAPTSLSTSRLDCLVRTLSPARMLASRRVTH